MPKVSIIIPTYNRKDLLLEALSSVFTQQYTDFEIIVVDHGSTDGTAAWVRETYGPRVRCLELPYCPLPACPRNAGIAAALGSYIAFLDSDDIWLPNKLALQVQALESAPQAGWSYGNARRFGDPSQENVLEIGRWQFHTGRVFNYLLEGNFIPTCTVMVRKSCLEEVGSFDMTPDLRTAEDYELLLRLAYRYVVSAIRQPIARYRVYPGNLSADLSRRFEPEEQSLLRIGEKLNLPAGVIQKARAAMHLRQFRYVAGSDPSKAAEHLRQSRQLDPWRFRTWLYILLWHGGGPGTLRLWIRIEKALKQWLGTASARGNGKGAV